MDILPVSVVALVIIIVGLIIGCVLLAINGFITDANDKQGFRHQVINFSLAFVCLALCIAVMVWIGIASSEKEVDCVVDYEVKQVTFPNGTTLQMFAVNGENYNANEMLGSIVPEGHVVRCTKYKRVYCGIFFSEDRIFLRDKYSVAKKE